MDTDISQMGLLAKCGLGTADVAQVGALADAVRRSDGVGLKLNLPRLVLPDPSSLGAPDLVSELCFYDQGRLVGYAPLDGDGGELEVTAAVLPSHRRRGVFRLLLGAARREARRRGANRLLLVGYRASLSGAAVVKALGLLYVGSEYRMEADTDALPPLDAGRVRLVPVNESNMTDLARLKALSFGGDPGSPASLLAETRAAGARYFLAERDGEQIGQIGVVDVGDSIYIRALGIVPNCRRRGHGRHLLAATLQALRSEGHRHFSLDVATDNAQALSLYESCGFRETDSYDYYNVPLTKP